jgi:RimJ/RimL family protein N-acetyltransferase
MGYLLKDWFLKVFSKKFTLIKSKVMVDCIILQIEDVNGLKTDSENDMVNSDQNLDSGKQKIQLREVEAGDLPIFYEQQLDPIANYMAAFTRKDPTDREAFDAHCKRILADETIPIMTILYDGQVVGSVLSYEQFGEREVSYWLGRDFWGKGIATQALTILFE